MKTKIFIKNWLFSFLFCIGLYLCLPILPQGLFSEVKVSSTTPIQAWRLSSNHNTLALNTDYTTQNGHSTSSPIKELYVQLGQHHDEDILTININSDDKFSFKYSEIKSKWSTVQLPIENMQSPNQLVYKVPSDVISKSHLYKFVPLINWSTININYLQIILIAISSIFVTILIQMVILPTVNNLSANQSAIIFPSIGLLIAFMIIYVFGKNFYWMDSLAFYNLAHAIENNALNWNTLWIQHNEHRILLVRLVYVFLSLFKPFNLLLLAYINQIILFITCIYINNAIQIKKFSRASYLSLIVSYFFFSSANMENTLQPFHGQWHGFMLGAILALYTASTNVYFIKKGLFWIGLLIAYASMPTWVTIPIAILLGILVEHFTKDGLKISRKQVIHFFVFGCITLILFGLYMYGWSSVSESPMNGIITNPLRFGIFFLQIIGNQINQPQLAAMSGIIVLILATILIREKIKGKLSFPAPLVYLFLFSIVWAFLTSVGRSAVGSATASRYTFISLGAWLSLYACLFMNWDLLSARKRFSTLTSLLLLFAVQNNLGFSYARTIEQTLQSDLEMVRAAVITNNPNELRFSQINPTLDLVNNENNRKNLLSEYLFLINKNYWIMPTVNRADD